LPDPRSLTRRDLLRGALGAVALAALPPPLRTEAAAERLHRLKEATGSDLDVALRCERWIRTSRTRTADGIAWPADPTKPDSVEPDFYNGMPGVVLFYLELYDATGEQAHLDEAVAGAAQLATTLGSRDLDAGLYSGVAGLGFVLAETWRRTGDAKHRDAARRAVALLKERAHPQGAGVTWNEYADIIGGISGTSLFLLYAARTLGDDGTVALAARAGRRLAELGTPAEGGLKWAVSPSWPKLYPNFSHGTAGASYALTALYEETGERRFLDAALAGAKYLDAVADHADGACKVFHDEPEGLHLFYLSWCHGGAGTARLFFRLAAATGDQGWLSRVGCYARGITTMGAPVKRSPGYWNNISQCCGDAGVGEFFLSLHKQWPDRGHLDVARSAAADILARATEEGAGLKWIQAENRVQPDFLVAQTGRMQGAAGVGTFFLHLDGLGAGRRIPTVLPDSPWP
jgi:lantibiotic modifying enzyme